MTTHLDKINDFVKRFDKETLSELNKCRTTQTFKKGDFLLKQGQICARSFEIKEGIARKYYLNDGKEMTTELFFKTDVAISFESYIFQKPSKEFIHALTDMRVSAIEYTAFQEAKRNNRKIAELDMLLSEHYVVWLEERMFQFHTLNATERYQLLLNNQPNIIQTVPLTHIASYLGISLETLSRLRAKL
jgi:CRP-like cAMP-binding protein